MNGPDIDVDVGIGFVKPYDIKEVNFSSGSTTQSSGITPTSVCLYPAGIVLL
jgi:hypothetical protein